MVDIMGISCDALLVPKNKCANLRLLPARKVVADESNAAGVV